MLSSVYSLFSFFLYFRSFETVDPHEAAFGPRSDRERLSTLPPFDDEIPPFFSSVTSLSLHSLVELAAARGHKSVAVAAAAGGR